MAYTNINGTPLKSYNAIPDYWNMTSNYKAATTHQEDGWREITEPEFNPDTHYKGGVVYDSKTDIATFEIIAFTKFELAEIAETKMLQQRDEAKQLLLEKLLAEKLQTLSDEDAEDFKAAFPLSEKEVKVGERYLKGGKLVKKQLN